MSRKGSKAINIRKATTEDSAALCDLMLEFGRYTSAWINNPVWEFYEKYGFVADVVKYVMKDSEGEGGEI